MTLMIFVNDLWTLKDIPLWLEHTAAMDDGMGLADTVFPAFLFITGMSIPLAVEQRRSKGAGNANIMLHILLRSIALLSMGLFLVNGEYLHASATGISRQVWNLIACTCFILIWNKWPGNFPRKIALALQMISVVLLLILAWICRTGEGENMGRFSTFWWGILGLIGWAYFVTAMIYTLSRFKIPTMILAWLLFVTLCIASHSGWLPQWGWLRSILAPIGDGAMPALVSGGTVITLIFLHLKNKNQPRNIFFTLCAMGILMIASGLLMRNFWIISKILATPTWVFICSGISILIFLLVYLIADVYGRPHWFALIKPAGTQTLLCYLLPYFAYAIFIPIGITLPNALLSGYLGLTKSLAFSLLIVYTAGLISKKGIRLKL